MITPKSILQLCMLVKQIQDHVGIGILRRSIQIRIPSRLEWSFRSVIPSIFLSRTSSAIFSIRRALFTRYGSSVTTIRDLPFGKVSIFVTARTRILPMSGTVSFLDSSRSEDGRSCREVRSLYDLKKPSIAVSLSSSTMLSMILTTALIVSRRLCGGILVAIPTAIPVVPFTKRFENVPEAQSAHALFHQSSAENQPYPC